MITDFCLRCQHVIRGQNSRASGSSARLSLGNDPTLQLNLGVPTRVGGWNINRDRVANIYLVCAKENHNVHL